MSFSTPRLPVTRPLLRFLRTPKGLVLIIFIGLLVVASFKVGGNVVMPKIIVAALTAGAIDMALTYLRRRRWVLPDGAVLTGMIVAFVLRPQESWLVLILIVAVAILSKHALRTHWSNILNPAAFALVVAAIAFKAGQDWWGALPDLGIVGAVVLLVAGVFIADRINKLPMILAFFGAYFTLLTVASFSDSAAVAETFRTPDLQAVLFFAFFMLDDPPTSPVRHEDQIVFGMIVAAVAYFILMRFGGIYFLPAGLLVGNLWESGRRLVLARIHARGTAAAGRARSWPSAASAPASPIGLQFRRLRVASGAATALVALVLVAAVVATSESPTSATTAGDVSVQQEVPPRQPAQPNAPYPFLDSFNADVAGTYSQTNNATESHLTIDATTTGDLALKMHLELVTAGGGGQRPSTVTMNKAQLLSVDANAVVCDGQLTAFNRQLVRATCDGTGPYQGVQMTFDPILNSDSTSTLSGSLSGTMQRTQ
jgi:hypothetical protein